MGVFEVGEADERVVEALGCAEVGAAYQTRLTTGAFVMSVAYQKVGFGFIVNSLSGSPLWIA